MIVKTLDDLRGTKGEKLTKHWSSMRFLHAEDRMGFSINDVTLHAGCDMIIEYKNHLETCYCIAGEGAVTDLATGRVHPLVPGTIYALDSHDRHRLQAFSEVRIICTFSPALIGGEEHRADGSYPAAKLAAAPRRPVAAKVKSRIGRAQKPGAKPKARAKKRGRR
jgi:L-ectoine synthase